MTKYIVLSIAAAFLFLVQPALAVENFVTFSLDAGDSDDVTVQSITLTTPEEGAEDSSSVSNVTLVLPAGDDSLEVEAGETETFVIHVDLEGGEAGGSTTIEIPLSPETQRKIDSGIYQLIDLNISALHCN